MQFAGFTARRLVAAALMRGLRATLALGVLTTLALGLCGVLPVAAASARSAHAQDNRSASRSHNEPLAHKHTSATLEACNAASSAQGGTATFAAQMTALPGAYELEMRFEVLERQPGQVTFHRPRGPGAPGRGSWRVSGPHVAVLKDFDEVTNLAAPALYRVRIRFRWLSSEGHPFHWAERETEPCRQQAPVSQSASSASR